METILINQPIEGWDVGNVSLNPFYIMETILIVVEQIELAETEIVSS